MDTTDASPPPTAPVHLRAYLHGRPVDYAALLSAVWDGVIDDLNRVEVAVGRRPYLSAGDLPVPEELAGSPPVSSESVRKGGR
jgi:hypothetical protein